VKYDVVVSPVALTELSALSRWWQTNRPDSRADLVGQFEQAMTFVAETPHAAPRYLRDSRYRTYRLGATPYVVFYRVDELRRIVFVAALWSGSRSASPHLP